MHDSSLASILVTKGSPPIDSCIISEILSGIRMTDKNFPYPHSMKPLDNGSFKFLRRAFAQKPHRLQGFLGKPRCTFRGTYRSDFL